MLPKFRARSSPITVGSGWELGRRIHLRCTNSFAFFLCSSSCSGSQAQGLLISQAREGKKKQSHYLPELWRRYSRQKSQQGPGVLHCLPELFCETASCAMTSSCISCGAQRLPLRQERWLLPSRLDETQIFVGLRLRRAGPVIPTSLRIM